MVGHNLIDTVYIEIGGQTIDTHYGDWLNIWNELTQSAEKEAGYNSMIGNTIALTTDSTDTTSTPAATLYVPLQFWLKCWPKKQLASNKKDSLMKKQLALLISMIPPPCFYPSIKCAVASKIILNNYFATLSNCGNFLKP